MFRYPAYFDIARLAIFSTMNGLMFQFGIRNRQFIRSIHFEKSNHNKKVGTRGKLRFRKEFGLHMILFGQVPLYLNLVKLYIKFSVATSLC